MPTARALWGARGGGRWGGLVPARASPPLSLPPLPPSTPLAPPALPPPPTHPTTHPRSSRDALAVDTARQQEAGAAPRGLDVAEREGLLGKASARCGAPFTAPPHPRTHPHTPSQFCMDGWLAAPPLLRGRYTLGVRSLLELGAFLLSLDLPPRTAVLLVQLVA